MKLHHWSNSRELTRSFELCQERCRPDVLPVPPCPCVLFAKVLGEFAQGFHPGMLFFMLFVGLAYLVGCPVVLGVGRFMEFLVSHFVDTGRRLTLFWRCRRCFATFWLRCSRLCRSKRLSLPICDVVAKTFVGGGEVVYRLCLIMDSNVGCWFWVLRGL